MNNRLQQMSFIDKSILVLIAAFFILILIKLPGNLDYSVGEYGIWYAIAWILFLVFMLLAVAGLIFRWGFRAYFYIAAFIALIGAFTIQGPPYTILTILILAFFLLISRTFLKKRL